MKSRTLMTVLAVLAVALLLAYAANAQTTPPDTVYQFPGADTLKPPVTITNFLRRIEMADGLMIQRSDSIFQVIRADIKENGEVIVHVGAYLTMDQAAALIAQQAESVVRKPLDPPKKTEALRPKEQTPKQ